MTQNKGFSDLSPCPFIAGPRIIDLRLFVGRKDELDYIATHMTGVQPISVNVVGERRIGKSSLLYHFFQTWEQRVQDPSRYVVVYLSLQNASSESREGFYQAIVRELLSRPSVQASDILTSALSLSSFEHSTFARALEQCKQNNMLPVLCLDEFEMLLKYTNEFDDTFYDHLRSLLDNNMLMLVLASCKSLDVYREKHSLTSSFFNLGHVLPLGDLTEPAATDLVRLPASTVSGAQAALSIEEQRQARQWGGRHPYLLQLAGSSLCHARRRGKAITWARGQFDAERRRLFEPASPIPYWWTPLRWLLWSLPIRLGRLSKYIRENFDDFKAWITGIVIIVAFLLVVVGLVTVPLLLALLKAIGVLK